MTISIALTKGRLEKKAIQRLEDSGYGVKPLKNKNRELIFYDTKKDVRYFLVKSRDCITYVEHGVADVGIVGKDTLYEGGKDYYELLDLKFGQCKFIVAAPPATDLFHKEGHLKIGTKYPSVARSYFLKRGMDVEIIKIEGSVELSPLTGLCDGIVDIMETGDTLRQNGLVVLDEVCNISARMIVNKAAFKLKREEILKLMEDLQEEKYVK